MIKNIKWLLLVSLSFVACNDDDAATEAPVSSGTADFSKYVALGDSFAAGYSDGALFKIGQTNSYPVILASQFALAGGGAFTVPYMEDNVGGFSAGGVQHPAFATRLYLNTQALPSAGPEPVTGVSGTPIGSHVAGTAAYSNLGVPGAKSFHLNAAGYGNPAGIAAGLANPYFARFATTASTSVKADALLQNPTFFSLWIGGNDILGYATAGGDATIDQITSTATFTAVYNQLAADMSNGGRKGVVANLPYISTLPHFTTIPLKPVPVYKLFVDGDETTTKEPAISPADVATVNALNAQLYGPLKAILNSPGIVALDPNSGSRIDVLSATGTNALLMKDESLIDLSAGITFAAANSGNPQLAALAPYLGATFGKARQTKTGDLIPLKTQGAIGTSAALPPGVPASLGKYGISYPLEDRHVLIPAEIAEIKAATDTYNLIIKAAADANNLAFVDAKAVMDQLVNGGVIANGYTFTATLVTGATFSLDGVHPSPRGYALIANKFIEAINAKYGSNLKGVNVGTFPILYPKNL